MLTVTRLEGRDAASAYAAAGGAVYRAEADGSRAELFRPFEAAAAGVPVHLAEAGGVLFVGAGPGGGPRLQTRDAATLAVLADVFVGDPAARTGVNLAPAGPAPGPRLVAVAHATRPGDPAGVQAALDRLPARDAAALAAVGQRVVVHGAAAVAGLPEFAALAGVPTTAAADDPGRTYDAVPSVGPGAAGDAITVRQDAPAGAVLHEVGHAVYALIGDDRRRFWAAVAARTAPPAPYEADPLELFAESYRRNVEGTTQPSAEVAAFFAGLAL